MEYNHNVGFPKSGHC